MDEFVGADYLSERGVALTHMAVNLENVTDPEARDLILVYMNKIVDSVEIEKPKATNLKVLPFEKQ